MTVVRASSRGSGNAGERMGRTRQEEEVTYAQFATMEYKLGSAERGRTLMEGVVVSSPKRIDLWSVFVDLELKSGHVEGARQLLERAITLKLKGRQAKFLFKKMLELEKTHGDAEGVAEVKRKAREWVESNAE